MVAVGGAHTDPILALPTHFRLAAKADPARIRHYVEDALQAPEVSCFFLPAVLVAAALPTEEILAPGLRD